MCRKTQLGSFVSQPYLRYGADARFQHTPARVDPFLLEIDRIRHAGVRFKANGPPMRRREGHHLTENIRYEDTQATLVFADEANRRFTAAYDASSCVYTSSNCNSS